MEKDLHIMNPWWENKDFESGLCREEYFSQLKKSLNSKDIVFLTGLRRAGKTTLLKQLIKELLKTVEPQKILYVTLDFINFKGYTIHDIVEEFRTLHKHTRETLVYLILDEVTSIASFEQELKNFYDLEEVKIFASSSSASLMKSKNSYLVGRSKTIEVLPLTFDEYLQFKKVSIKESESYLEKKYFDDYLRDGGMPEYVLTGDMNYLKNTIEQIMYKDIIALHDIKDKDAVEKLFLLLCERVGKQFTYAKLARVLGISVDSVRRYIGYFKDTFLFYTIDKYAKSLNERTYAPKKLYIADTGIRNIFTGFRDKGAMFENVVFCLLRRGKVNYYYDSGKEIDFIYTKGKKKIAVEAKYKEKINEDELKFFKKAKFKEKRVIKNYEDLKKLEGEL